MMDFTEAVQAMKEGKKVRLKSLDFCYYQLKGDNIVCYNIDKSIHYNQSLRLTIEIEGTDWEIYEEDWNLSSVKYTIPGPVLNARTPTLNVYLAKDVLKLKMKIIENIKSELDCVVTIEIIEDIIHNRCGF